MKAVVKCDRGGGITYFKGRLCSSLHIGLGFKCQICFVDFNQLNQKNNSTSPISGHIKTLFVHPKIEFQKISPRVAITSLGRQFKLIRRKKSLPQLFCLFAHCQFIYPYYFSHKTRQTKTKKKGECIIHLRIKKPICKNNQLYKHAYKQTKRSICW